LVDNIKYQFDFGPGSWLTAKELFDRKKGDCEDDATFITYCLLHSGYDYDEFDTHETDAACSLFLASPSDPNQSSCARGHAVTLVKIDGKIYYFDAVKGAPVPDYEDPHIKGPFNSIEEAANEAWQWTVYTIEGDHPRDEEKGVYSYSKPFKEWVWKKNIR